MTDILEQLAPRFTSGNSVPVEKAFVTLEEFNVLSAELRETRYHRQLLMDEIATASHTAGIYNGEVPLDGPQCLMMVQDMAEIAAMYKGLCD